MKLFQGCEISEFDLNSDFCLQLGPNFIELLQRKTLNCKGRGFQSPASNMPVIFCSLEKGTNIRTLFSGLCWFTVCRKPTVMGPCRGRFVRWTFSTLLNKCTMFVYGGCRGNENQYESQEECESMCGHLSKCPRANYLSHREYVSAESQMAGISKCPNFVN